jgi:hypothetical protein
VNLVPDDAEKPVVAPPMALAPPSGEPRGETRLPLDRRTTVMPAPDNRVTMVKDPAMGTVTVRLLRADERGRDVVDTTTASAEEERVRLAARLLRTGLMLQQAARVVYRDLEDTGGLSPSDVQRHAANVRRQCPAVAMVPARSGQSSHLDESGDT